MKGRSLAQLDEAKLGKWGKGQKDAMLKLWNEHVPHILAGLHAESLDWCIMAKDEDEGAMQAHVRIVYISHCVSIVVYPFLQHRSKEEVFETMLHECIHILLADMEAGAIVLVELVGVRAYNAWSMASTAGEEKTVARMLSWLSYNPKTKKLELK